MRFPYQYIGVIRTNKIKSSIYKVNAQQYAPFLLPVGDKNGPIKPPDDAMCLIGCENQHINCLTRWGGSWISKIICDAEKRQCEKDCTNTSGSGGIIIY